MNLNHSTSSPTQRRRRRLQRQQQPLSKIILDNNTIDNTGKSSITIDNTGKSSNSTMRNLFPSDLESNSSAFLHEGSSLHSIQQRLRLMGGGGNESSSGTCGTANIISGTNNNNHNTATIRRGSGLQFVSECTMSSLEYDEEKAKQQLLEDTYGFEDDENIIFGVQKNKVVLWLKVFLIIVLISSSISVACGVYFYTSNSELSKFEENYADDVHKLIDGIRSSMELTLGAVELLVFNLVSYSNSSNKTWPFVTVPNFAIKASKTLLLSNAVFVNVYPLVTDDLRIQWEEYSIQNDYWVDEGIKIQKDDPLYHGPIIENYTVEQQIYDYYGPITNRTGPYMPIWQSAPVIPRYPPYNWDLRSSTDLRSINQIMESQKVIITEAYLLPDPNDIVAIEENAYFIDFFSDFVKPGEDPSEPVSDWYYPILDTVKNVYIEDTKKEKFVGIVALSVYWRDMLKESLPPGSNGIIVVFENSCNPTFTYQINGSVPIYLGRGDLHNPKYDYLKVSTKLLESDRRETSSYTGIGIDEEYCPFTIHLYPSDTMENDYTSSDPVIYTVAAVMIFAFTSTIFFIYDRLVEQRQNKILSKALMSNQHVSFLEKKVKERTRKLELTNSRLEVANRHVRQASAAQLEHFACMSHEIRTPLNCIIGLSSLLEESQLNPMQKDSIRMIVHSGDLLLRVVDDVLDYSKLESGNVEVEIQRSNLQETLDSVVHLIETKARSKRLSLRTTFDPTIAEYIMTDSRRLQQILYNLLGNALKFSIEDGIVELNVFLCTKGERRKNPNRFYPYSDSNSSDNKNNNKNNNKQEESNKEEEQQQNHEQAIIESLSLTANDVTTTTNTTTTTTTSPNNNNNNNTSSRNLIPIISLSDADDTQPVICFVIKDYGKGISERDIKRIFRPFSQASASTERLYGGTGLGLAIVSRLVKALGGAISVESEQNKFTEFTVELPFNEPVIDINTITKRYENSTIYVCGNGKKNDKVNTHNITQLMSTLSKLNIDSCIATSIKDIKSMIEQKKMKNVNENDSSNEEEKKESTTPPPPPTTTTPTNINNSNNNDRVHVCLVHEDQYDKDAATDLVKNANSGSSTKTVLLTYGDKYQVQHGQGHYRSLVQMMPSVLMQRILGHVEVAVRGAPNDKVREVSKEVANSMVYKTWKFLIAEDNVVNQKVLKRILNRLGVEHVDIVENGLLAVEKEKTTKYDVVLMDMQMPVMDGYDACIQICNRPEIEPHNHKRAKIIFCTAHVSDSFESECHSAGAVGFLAKPCNIRTVEKCLQQVADDHFSS